MPIYSNETLSESAIPLLSETETNQFLEAIDQTLLEVDFHKFITTCKAFGVYETGDFDTNLDTIQRIEHSLGPKDKRKIKNVNTRLSRCAACYLGKTIKVYSLEYSRPMDDCDIRGIYQTEFGFMTATREGKLMDFGFCNLFLSGEECESLGIR